MFRRSEQNKPLDEEWHRRRHEARRNAFSLSEFGDPEITRFDLDTAGITGRDNPQTYKYDPVIDLLGIDGHGIKDLRRHD